MFKALPQELRGTLTTTFDRHLTIEDFTEMDRNTRIVNETRVIVLVQARTQASQCASVIDCAGNITNFTEICAGKSFFFLPRLKGDLFLNFCVSHKKKYNHENIPFVKTSRIYVFIKGIMSGLKTNV